MRRDSLVEEIRKNRAAIAQEHGDDVDVIIAAFQREDAISGVATASFPPKRVLMRVPRRKLKTRRPNKAQQTGERRA
jgi:hypothetical protein